MFKIINTPIEKFVCDEVIFTTSNIILVNNETNEEYFMPKALNYEFKKKIDKSIEDGKSLMEYKFEIFFKHGESEKKNRFIAIQGINVLEKIKKIKKFDY